MKNTDNKFVVFDVETPNSKNDSICAIALVVIDATTYTIVDKFYSLVNPEADFSSMNISINNITPDMVKDSPTFPDIWGKIGGLFENSIVVAHNANFDINVIKKILTRYNIDCKPICTICTFSVAKDMLSLSDYKLTTVAKHFDIELNNHHDALEDTVACANIFLNLLKIDKDLIIDNFLRVYNMDSDNNLDLEVQQYSTRNKHYSAKTNNLAMSYSLQIFQGILIGLSFDDIISDKEISALKGWVVNNNHLSGDMQFDKIHSVLLKIPFESTATNEQKKYLSSIISQVINPVNACSCNASNYSSNDFDCKNICLTGDFAFGSRSSVANYLQSLGSIIQSSVNKNTNFVIVGSCGSEAYSHGTYGTKIKKAIELQNDGQNIKIIKEEDISELLEGVLC